MKRWLLAIIVLASMGATDAHALTLSQIQTEIRLRIKDTHATRRRYSDTQILNMINEAQRDINNAVWVTIKSTSIVTLSGTTYYATPSDFIVPIRVTRDYKVIPETSMDSLDNTLGGSAWESVGGAPQFYFINYSSSSAIGLYPFPNSATSTGTVRMIYVCQPNAMAGASDVPFNNETKFVPYHDIIIFYVAYRVYLIEGEIDKATLYRQEYESRLTVMHDRVGKSPNFSPGFSAARK